MLHPSIPQGFTKLNPIFDADVNLSAYLQHVFYVSNTTLCWRKRELTFTSTEEVQRSRSVYQLEVKILLVVLWHPFFMLMVNLMTATTEQPQQVNDFWSFCFLLFCLFLSLFPKLVYLPMSRSFQPETKRYFLHQKSVWEDLKFI